MATLVNKIKAYINGYTPIDEYRPNYESNCALIAYNKARDAHEEVERLTSKMANYSGDDRSKLYKQALHYGKERYGYALMSSSYTSKLSSVQCAVIYKHT